MIFFSIIEWNNFISCSSIRIIFPAIVEPVCLPKSDFNAQEYMGGASAVAAGWGLTEHGNFSDILLRVDVQLEENTQCKERYEADFVTKQVMC